MGEILPDPALDHLRAIFDRGAEQASLALTRWIGRPVSLEIGDLGRVALDVAIQAVGPGESLVAACLMELSGPIDGKILLIFADEAGLALVDLLLQQPTGTCRSWGELERSAAKETANILGCAYVSALASHLPAEAPSIVPGPPHFRHEFAASLLEFALMDQALVSDEVLLVRTRFAIGGERLEWSLLFVPGSASVEALSLIFRP